ncbi:hypothetical protein F3157_14715 [Virgibacillus dakarensis]|uniref:Uncharacterized protein n=1 Tax=Lentibacillus populi TaxID=1827502 RepID=A0A9W5X6I6_9BACI|nr:MULTISPECIES: hypothetical protein [Bacillaceae]MBT2216881.1 hypothetical protein [Virgibacillus dakarensis]MTW86902.1 hypothetical protein [Virgibacillus dakarensis]GGB52346.1 hypothetical protein GCM10011409_32380 [Lentibacillus populi]
MPSNQKKKFPIPTKANTDGKISVSSGLGTNNPLNEEDNFAGDSVDEHKELEAANEVIAEKIISQVNNNS